MLDAAVEKSARLLDYVQAHGMPTVAHGGGAADAGG